MASLGGSSMPVIRSGDDPRVRFTWWLEILPDARSSKRQLPNGTLYRRVKLCRRERAQEIAFVWEPDEDLLECFVFPVTVHVFVRRLLRANVVLFDHKLYTGDPDTMRIKRIDAMPSRVPDSDVVASLGVPIFTLRDDTGAGCSSRSPSVDTEGWNVVQETVSRVPAPRMSLMMLDDGDCESDASEASMVLAGKCRRWWRHV